MIALMVFTNGRSTIHQTIASAEANLQGPITERWIHDDSGDTRNHEILANRYPEYTLIAPSQNLGFGGAIRNAWDHLRQHSAAEFIWHQEDDFLFNRPVDLYDLIYILNNRPALVNLALRRQPVNYTEAQAGGVVECWPDAYEDWTLKVLAERGEYEQHWLEHRLFFTTNPGLYRRRLLWEFDWPTGSGSEGQFTQDVLSANEEAKFGYYGSRASGEAVHHIGERTGTGY